jgi:hypothetical protein
MMNANEIIYYFLFALFENSEDLKTQYQYRISILSDGR